MLRRISALAAMLALTFQLSARPDPVVEGKKVSEWIGMLKGGKPEGQVAALQAFGKMPFTPAEAVPALLEIFRTNASGQLGESVLSLLERCDAAGAASLSTLLDKGDEKERAMAAYALGRLGIRAKAAIPSLLAVAKNAPDPVRWIAIRALGNLRVREAVPILLAAAEEKDGLAQSVAVGALALLDAPAFQLTPVLTRMMQDKDAVKRTEAVRLCAMLGPEAKPLIPALLKALEAGDHTASARSLGAMGPGAREALPALRAALVNPAYAETIDTVAGALWKIEGDPKCADALVSPRYDAWVSRPNHIQIAEMLWIISRDPKAITVFREALRKPVSNDLYAAMQALIRIGPPAKDAVPELIELLKSKEPNLPAFAASVLGRIGPAAAAAVQELRALLKNLKGDERSFAGFDLWRVDRSDEALLAAVEGLKSDRPEMRYQIANDLGYFGAEAKSALPALRAALKHPNGDTRLIAAVTIHRIEKSNDALPVAVESLRDKDPNVRRMAAMALGFDFGDAVPIPMLAAALKDDDASVRSSAAEALGRTGSRAGSATPVLMGALKDEEDFVVTAAVEALGLLGTEAKAALPAIKGLFKHPDPYIRAQAVLASWNLEKDQANLPMAKAGLNSRHPKARVVSAEACGAMGETGPAVETLMATLRDFEANSNDHYMAVRALGRLGPAAKPAIPLLVRFLENMDPELVKTARDSIRKIDQ